MRHLVLSLLVAATAAAPSLAATRDFRVGGFDRVRSDVPYDVRVRTGTPPGVRATGSQDMLDRLTVEVQNGELRIGTRQGRWWSGFHWSGQHALIEVGGPMIGAATLSGPGNLTIDHVRGPRFAAAVSGPGDLAVGLLETGQLNATLSGPGDLTLTGRAETANLVLSGPGDIRAGNLTARQATVLLSGPGDITATVTGAVRGTLSGPGDITIRGGARCDITKHGPGDVHCP